MFFGCRRRLSLLFCHRHACPRFCRRFLLLIIPRMLRARAKYMLMLICPDAARPVFFRHDIAFTVQLLTARCLPAIMPRHHHDARFANCCSRYALLMLSVLASSYVGYAAARYDMPLMEDVVDAFAERLAITHHQQQSAAVRDAR